MSFCSTFTGYYYKPRATAYEAWDPTLKHRRPSADFESVSISQVAKDHPVPSKLKNTLNKIITPEIYRKLCAQKLDVDYLKTEGFIILNKGKKGSARIFTHQRCSTHLIKVRVKSCYTLPMEGPIKNLEALREARFVREKIKNLEALGEHKEIKKLEAERQKKKSEAWYPLRNTNLLRPVGRAFFAQQIKNLPKEEQKYYELPKEYLYPCPHAHPKSRDRKRFFSISERKRICSEEETLQRIQNADEKTQRLVIAPRLLQLANMRMHDLHRSNVRLSCDSSDFKFVLIDTEPIGIIMDKADTTGAHLFNPAEQVLLGMIKLRDRFCYSQKLITLTTVVNEAIVDYLNEHPEISVQREDMYYKVLELPASGCQIFRAVLLTVVSVLCPLIPLILAICALWEAYLFPPENPHSWDKYEKVEIPRHERAPKIEKPQPKELSYSSDF
jgi:hypothetical protein